MPNNTSVLIVDDDANFGNTLAKVLRKKGYMITTAEDGPRAIALVQERSYDAILMDVKMPVMDGFETYKNIKKIRPAESVIFMTAFSAEDLVKSAIKDGAYAMIKKPLDIESLVNLIEKSGTGALLAVVDDDPNMGRTMKDALEKKGYSVALCRTGEEAISLAKDKARNMFFIDMKLPILNGLEVYLELKKVNPEAVMVMMAAAYKPETEEMVGQALKEGAYACLYKPFDMGEAIAIIEEIFKKKQK